MNRIKLRPAKRLVVLTAFILLLMLVCAIAQFNGMLLTALLLVPALVAIVDCLAAKSSPLLEVSAETNLNMALYRRQDLNVLIKNNAKHAKQLDVIAFKQRY